MCIRDRYWVKRYRHWSDKGIDCPEPRFPFGNTKDNVTKLEIMIKDPDIIKQIMTKDFKYFTDRAKLLVDEKGDPLSNHLFFMSGEKWKNMRVKLTPTFTSGKMKLMFFLMKSCADHLKDIITRSAEKSQIININDFMARYTTCLLYTSRCV